MREREIACNCSRVVGMNNARIIKAPSLELSRSLYDYCRAAGRNAFIFTAVFPNNTLGNEAHRGWQRCSPTLEPSVDLDLGWALPHLELLMARTSPYALRSLAEPRPWEGVRSSARLTHYACVTTGKIAYVRLRRPGLLDYYTRPNSRS